MIDGAASFREIWSWFFLLAALVPLYQASRVHYFEGPARARELARWIEETHPETWARLPAQCRGLLVTLEYPQHEKSGPPFPVAEDEVRARFEGQWTVALLERRDIIASEPSFQAEGVSALSTAVYRFARAAR